jgi:hypothetical protein
MSALKGDAIREPFCTILSAQSVVTDAVQLGGEMDVMTLPRGFASCSSALIPQGYASLTSSSDQGSWIPFSTRAARHDFVHGFAVYFDCIFSFSDPPAAETATTSTAQTITVPPGVSGGDSIEVQYSYQHDKFVAVQGSGSGGGSSGGGGSSSSSSGAEITTATVQVPANLQPGSTFDVPMPLLHSLWGWAPQAMVLSTSPFWTPTHWGQTVFFLQKEYVVPAGQRVHGEIKFTSVAENPRDIRVVIRHSLVGQEQLVGQGEIENEQLAEQQWTLRTELRY